MSGEAADFSIRVSEISVRNDDANDHCVTEKSYSLPKCVRDWAKRVYTNASCDESIFTLQPFLNFTINRSKICSSLQISHGHTID